MKDKIKIIYVDDEEINILLFKLNISKKFEVFTGANGEDGLELLKQNPDAQVVVSDMRMPGMSGISFIERAKKEFPNINYFIITGFEISKEIKDAEEAGLITKFFTKPFSTKEFELVISNLYAL